MQKTTVKIIKLINGDDIVTVLPTGDKQLPDNGPLIRLDKPLQIKYVPQITPMGFRDYIAMIRWTNYTNDKIVTIPKDKILTITNASNEMIKSYRSVIVDYNNYDKLVRREENERTRKLMDREMMSPSEREEFEEIFDDFDDSTCSLIMGRSMLTLPFIDRKSYSQDQLMILHLLFKNKIISVYSRPSSVTSFVVTIKEKILSEKFKPISVITTDIKTPK